LFEQAEQKAAKSCYVDKEADSSFKMDWLFRWRFNAVA
jgi:hypothetical protein